MISALSPLQIRRNLSIGAPGWALVRGIKPCVTVAIFCLVVLGAGSFDGLNETFWWFGLIGVNPLNFPGRTAIITETTLGFIAVNILLILAFALCVYLGNRLTGPSSGPGFRRAFSHFALSTLPIGLGFHIAHYTTTLLISGQYAFAALTDPFGTGADYLDFGRARVFVGFLRDQDVVLFLWMSQAALIVGSHIVALLIAHAMSRKLYATEKQARLAELPLSAFMIFYTVFGLWLLAAARGA